MKKIKFMRYYVTDGETKAKIHYSACDSYGFGNDKRKAVTLYEQGYERKLLNVFSDGYSNEKGFIVYCTGFSLLLFCFSATGYSNWRILQATCIPQGK